MTAPLFLNAREVAARYGVDYTTVWRWRSEDPDFPKAIVISQNTVRFKLSELEAWEESKRDQRGARA